MFVITNTTCTIDLSGADLESTDGVLLIADAEKWGTSGSNGGNATLNAAGRRWTEPLRSTAALR